MTTKNGARGSTYAAYLKEAETRSQLTILTYALVERVLIDDASMRAYGVQYRKNERSYVVRARNEIIVSAGAIGTPQILMLSGIGPKDHLNALGVMPFIDFVAF